MPEANRGGWKTCSRGHEEPFRRSAASIRSGVDGVSKHHEERTALRADLGPLVLMDRLPDDPMVSLKEFDVVVAELREELGRPLDV